eukprot:jgi/Orpsp1_1/1187908/evm.model.d7180000061048.1
MLTQSEINYYNSTESHRFIENIENPSFFSWLGSKGTHFECYIEYLNTLNPEQKLDNKIANIRTVIYALHEPIKFIFFYWTILIFILYKFNFRKPVMKIVLLHFVLRALGDVINRFGDLEIMNHYYTKEPVYNEQDIQIGLQCRYDSGAPERNPLKWFLTRQIGCTLWCLGEIVGDWYPLLRTRALAKGQKLMRIVYITCGLFNISKLSLIILHYTLNPAKIYNKELLFENEKVLDFYFNYWTLQLFVIYSSLIYDFSVYYVLKRNLSGMGKISGFLRKFKTISQYRIYVSVIISLIFLPLFSITIFIKYYYRRKYGYINLNFSFDEIKNSINNVQYYMIFIDQILLLHTRDDSVREYSYTVQTESTYPTTDHYNKENPRRNKNKNITISEPLSASYNSNFLSYTSKDEDDVNIDFNYNNNRS